MNFTDNDAGREALPIHYFTMSKWTKTYPTKADAGKWFVMRKLNTKLTFDNVQFVEIRVDKSDVVHVCPPCNTGIDKTSYGTPLDMYRAIKLEFFPLAMPPDYRG